MCNQHFVSNMAPMGMFGLKRRHGVWGWSGGGRGGEAEGGKHILSVLLTRRQQLFTKEKCTLDSGSVKERGWVGGGVSITVFPLAVFRTGSKSVAITPSVETPGQTVVLVQQYRNQQKPCFTTIT